MNAMNPGAAGPAIQYFGDYILLGRLAEGGMGVVYDARQVSLNRRVAVKVIRAGALATEAERHRFRVEAEAAAQLEHPNIVPVYEVGEHQAFHYISMRLIEGGSLADQIREGHWSCARGDEAQRQRASAILLAKAARAVHHAHQRGIIHRDLKPGNLLLDEAGEPYLADFGLAKLLDGGRDLTLSSSVLGTPSYMAPEQAAGQSRDVTTAADTYSLGAILYELLTGRPPFEGATTAEIQHRVLREEPRPPRELVPAIDRDLETICLKCLHKEPARRYLSAQALAEDLERWGRGEPILARPMTWPERGLLWVRRHPLTAGLIVAIGVSLALGAAGMTWQWQQAETERDRTSQANLRLRLQRAEDQFTREDPARALAELAHLLREQPANRVVAERMLNALDQRVFLLPSTNAALPILDQPPFRLAIVERKHLQVSRPDGSTVTLSNAHQRIIRSLTHSADGTRILSAAADGKAKVWAADLRSPPVEFDHGEALNDAAFAPDGRRVVTAGDDGVAQLWEVATGGKWAAPMRHPLPVQTARFSPDGLLVLTACQDDKLRFWDGASGLPMSWAIGGPANLSTASFGQVSSRVVVIDGDSIRHGYRISVGVSAPDVTEAEAAWARTNAPLPASRSLLPVRTQLFERGLTNITILALDPGRRVLATASSDRAVRLWDARSLHPLAEPLLHDQEVNCLQFSPDGLRLATSTAGKEVRWWDVFTGQPLSHRLHLRDRVPGVAFLPDGDWVVAAGMAWKRRVHRIEGQAPTWLPALGEAVGGTRLGTNGLVERVPVADFYAVRQQVLTSPATDRVTAWAREFLADEPAPPRQ